MISSLVNLSHGTGVMRLSSFRTQQSPTKSFSHQVKKRKNILKSWNLEFKNGSSLINTLCGTGLMVLSTFRAWGCFLRNAPEFVGMKLFKS